MDYYSLLVPLFGLGGLTLDQGDFAAAVAPLERGLELCRTREVPGLLHYFAGRWARRTTGPAAAPRGSP